MTKQELQKSNVRFLLERMWKNYQVRINENDHELVLLAVPKYPANIEAVSAMDLSDINDIMAVFAKHREDHPDELHPIEQTADVTPEQAGEIVDEAYGLGRFATDGPVEVGQGDDGGGAPQERAEPAPEPHEGDAAADAMELMPKPVIELTHEAGPTHIRVWANGRTEGLDGQIINRVPELLAEYFKHMKAAAVLSRPIVCEMSEEQLAEAEKEYQRPGGITWIEPPYERITTEQLAKHFGVSIEQAEAAQGNLGFMYRQRASVPPEDIKLVDDLMRDVMGGAKPKEIK